MEGLYIVPKKFLNKLTQVLLKLDEMCNYQSLLKLLM